MDADAEAPAVIQVPITISQEGPKYKESVKRKTRHHELVEVDGFVFRRKRRIITPSPAPPPAVEEAAARSPAAIKLALQLDAATPTAADQTADDAALGDQATATEAKGQLSAEPVTADVHAAEAEAAAEELDMVPATQDLPEAPEVPQQFSLAPSELVYMVEWVLISELKKLPGMTADSAQKVAAEIKEQFATQLHQHQAGSGQAADGEQQGQEGAAAPQASQATLLPYQVEQLKAALLDKRNRLLEEEAAWLQLRQQYSSLIEDGMSPTLAETAAAGDNNDSQQAPTADGAAAAPTNEAAALPDAAADNAAEPPKADDAALLTPAAAAAADSSTGPVTTQGESILRGVSLKVEMLMALVAKMEHLISSAEVAARTLQVGYQNEIFKVFPHVNSPAALIKSMTQSQPHNP